jgi:hypothetical protein
MTLKWTLSTIPVPRDTYLSSEPNSNPIQLPNSLHYEWSIKALSAGKHLMVEKPVVTRAEVALKMHESAEQKGLILLV